MSSLEGRIFEKKRKKGELKKEKEIGEPSYAKKEISL